MAKNKLQKETIPSADLLETLENIPVSTASDRIDAIAHYHGDAFSRNLLEKTPSIKIAAMLMHSDFSLPSIISTILSPAKVVKVLKCFPLFWMHCEDIENQSRLIRFRDEALEQLINFILDEKQLGRQAKILEGIGHNSICCGLLLLAFHGWRIGDEQRSFFEHHDIEPGTHEQLYEIIRWQAPGLADEIKTLTDTWSDRNGNHPQISLYQQVMDVRSDYFDTFFPDKALKFFEENMFRVLNEK